MRAWILPKHGGVELLVLVQPRASRTQIVGEHDGRLKIALAAPPVDGEANAALFAFLARRLGVRQSALVLIDGEASRRKRLFVQGMEPDAAVELLS